ncbi:MAG: FecR domain-containing protein [Niabella sp.]
MENSKEYYTDLLSRFIRDELSIEEIETLFAYLKSNPQEYKQLFDRSEMLDLIEKQASAILPGISGEKESRGVRNIDESIRQMITKESFRRNSTSLRNWYWVAAACVIALLGIGLYYYAGSDKQQQPSTAINAPKDIEAPATNRAMITLADGSRVYLDSANNGQLAQLGNIKLVKLSNGQITYQAVDGTRLKELQYNTLTNPRGSKVINIQLSDGSHVWLNAGSSITYPVAFVDGERKVELKGEGYFEIAKANLSASGLKESGVRSKFTVIANGTTTEVLGTHFNVNAYEDEKSTKVTLLEGSVKVSKGRVNAIIRPGQQAQVTNDVKTVNDTDLEAVMAWKNEYFQFEGVGIEDVMRQISRWYDVEVVYEVQPKQAHFRGRISRAVEASKVFKMLETTQAVHFRIEGRKVYIIR